MSPVIPRMPSPKYGVHAVTNLSVSNWLLVILKIELKASSALSLFSSRPPLQLAGNWPSRGYILSHNPSKLLKARIAQLHTSHLRSKSSSIFFNPTIEHNGIIKHLKTRLQPPRPSNAHSKSRSRKLPSHTQRLARSCAFDAFPATTILGSRELA